MRSRKLYRVWLRKRKKSIISFKLQRIIRLQECLIPNLWLFKPKNKLKRRNNLWKSWWTIFKNTAKWKENFKVIRITYRWSWLPTEQSKRIFSIDWVKLGKFKKMFKSCNNYQIVWVSQIYKVARRTFIFLPKTNSYLINFQIFWKVLLLTRKPLLMLRKLSKKLREPFKFMKKIVRNMWPKWQLSLKNNS